MMDNGNAKTNIFHLVSNGIPICDTPIYNELMLANVGCFGSEIIVKLWLETLVKMNRPEHFEIRRGVCPCSAMALGVY